MTNVTTINRRRALAAGAAALAGGAVANTTAVVMAKSAEADPAIAAVKRWMQLDKVLEAANLAFDDACGDTIRATDQWPPIPLVHWRGYDIGGGVRR